MAFFKHIDDYSDITDITFNDRKRFAPLDKVSQKILRGKSPFSEAELVQADAEKVYEAGWSEQALYDAICIGCLFNFYNRLLDGHGIKGNDNIYYLGGQHLHKNGYGVPWFIGLIKNNIRKSKIRKLKSI